MANNDQVLELYHGRIDSRRSQVACRARIHWMCERVVGRRILDIGCSQGICPIILGREGHEVIGMDIEEAAIQTARKALSEEPARVQERVQFIVADAFATEFDPGSFDTVIIGEVLEHLATPGKLLELAANWLVEGGQIVVSVPLAYHPHHDHKRTFYLSNLLDLLGEHFRVVEVAPLEDLYLCVTAVRPRPGESRQIPAAESLLAWNRACEQSLERRERELYEKWRGTRDKLSAQVPALQEKVARNGEALAAAREEVRRVAKERRWAWEELKLARQELTHLRKELARLQEQECGLHDQAQRARQAHALIREEWHRSQKEAAQTVREKSELERLLGETQKRLERNANESKRALETERDARRRLRKRLERRNRSIEYLRAEMDRRAQEVRYLLGDAFVKASRPSVDTLLLPGRLVRLFLRGRRQQWARKRKQAAGATPDGRAASQATASPEVSAGSGQTPAPAKSRVAGAAPSAKKEPAPPQRVVAQATKPIRPAPPTDGNNRKGAKPAVAAPQITFPPYKPSAPSKRSRLKAASILDAFSQACFSPEMELIAVTKAGWKDEIEQAQPDFFFAESAWHGNDDEWKGLFAQYAQTPDNPLRDLLGWCRESGLPTVLWNKEDPPNYEHFIDVAKDFQYVFTSDADSIPRYRQELGHDRVYPLPFAAQPIIHNPLGAHELRRYGVCFAGSWHARKHPSRRCDMQVVIEPALTMGLHIFDRCANMKNNQQRRFPEIYQPAIRGSLDYDRMLSAYRAYRVFLNVNSVSDSPTMFSRRVFELLACGTSVISSESKGVRQMFGDLVPITTSPEETRFHLERLLGDEEYRQRLAHLGYRRVMREHTYRDRLRTIVSEIGLGQPLEDDAAVSVVVVLKRPDDLDSALESYACQKHEAKELHLVLGCDGMSLGDLERRVAGRPRVHVYQRRANQTLGECLNSVADRCNGQYVAKFDGGSRYGPDYLTDALLPFRFVDAGVVGKHSHYGYLGESDTTVLHSPGGEHQLVESVLAGTLVIKRDVLASVRFHSIDEGIDTIFQQGCRAKGIEIYSADRFNFVAVQAADRERAAVDADRAASREKRIPCGTGLRLDEAMLGDDPGRPRVAYVPTAPVADRERLEPLTANTSRLITVGRVARADSSDKRGVLFYCVNGGGLGHLTRSLAIARRMRRLSPPVPIYFLSSSQALGVISREGIIAYHIPPRSAYGARLSDQAWNDLLLEHLQLIVETHRPAGLVYDGVSPYTGLAQAIAQSEFAHTAMVLRLRHKHDRVYRLVDRLSEFDLLVLPGEAGVEVPHAVAALNHRVFDPIVFLDRDELLPRAEARQRWNITPEKKAVYVQLGAGNINDIAPWVGRILAVLKARDDVEIILAESPVADRAHNPCDGVHILGHYPNSLYFNGFDLAITAVGYNTFHEVMHFGVPSVLIPNQETMTDDQVARAKTAETASAAKVVLTFDELEGAITQALNEDIAATLRKNALALVPANGARAVAECLLESAYQQRASAPDLAKA